MGSSEHPVRGAISTIDRIGATQAGGVAGLAGRAAAVVIEGVKTGAKGEVGSVAGGVVAGEATGGVGTGLAEVEAGSTLFVAPIIEVVVSTQARGVAKGALHGGVAGDALFRRRGATLTTIVACPTKGSVSVDLIVSFHTGAGVVKG